jgi:hypothetical protein
MRRTRISPTNTQDIYQCTGPDGKEDAPFAQFTKGGIVWLVSSNGNALEIDWNDLHDMVNILKRVESWYDKQEESEVQS